ncbi:MAG: hypothetical protein ACOCNB_08705, partial [Acetivibrio ethanolgignens]
YMNNAKESKDYQIISTFGTAAVTAATEYAEYMTDATPYEFNLYGTGTGTAPTGDFETKVAAKVKELTYSTVDNLKKDLKSKNGQSVTDITITITKAKVTAKAVGGNFETVESTIGQ